MSPLMWGFCGIAAGAVILIIFNAILIYLEFKR